MQGFDMLNKPLGEGPGEEPVPELNTDYTQPGPTTGGGQDLYTLATIANLESGSPQGQADVAQSIYNRMKQSGKGVVDVTTSPGQYQPFFGKGGGIDPKSKNIKTFDDAVKYRMKKTGENRATAERSILSTISAIQDPSKQTSSREFVGTRTSFRGSPQNTGNTLRNVSWRGSKSDNQFLNEEVVSGGPGTVPSFVSSPTKSTQVQQTPSGKGGKVVEYITGDRTHKRYAADHGGRNYHDHVAFDSQATRDSAMKWLRSRGWTIGSIDTGKHADGSFHYSKQAFDIPFYDGGNYRKKGVTDDAKGETKFSSMVRADLIAGGFGGPQLGGSSTAPVPSAQVSSTTSPGQNVPSVAQNKKGPTVLIADNPQQPQPQQVSAGGGGSQPQMIPTESSLNSLIKNQILLELAYT
jgi:hypothetical protein